VILLKAPIITWLLWFDLIVVTRLSIFIDILCMFIADIEASTYIRYASPQLT